MIGNIAVGFQYLEMPLVIALATRHPHWIQTMSWCALAACSLALFLSSFATAVSVLQRKFRLDAECAYFSPLH